MAKSTKPEFTNAQIRMIIRAIVDSNVVCHIRPLLLKVSDEILTSRIAPQLPSPGLQQLLLAVEELAGQENLRSRPFDTLPGIYVKMSIPLPNMTELVQERIGARGLFNSSSHMFLPVRDKIKLLPGMSTRPTIELGDMHLHPTLLIALGKAVQDSITIIDDLSMIERQLTPLLQTSTLNQLKKKMGVHAYMELRATPTNSEMDCGVNYKYLRHDKLRTLLDSLDLIVEPGN